MTTEDFYVVRWVLAAGERYLLWRDGGDEPDEYALVRGLRKPVVARSMQELARTADINGLSINKKQAQVIDFQAVRAILASLRPGRPLSERSARVLLDAWNALDDLENSLGECFVSSEKSQTEEIKSAYDKLFYGNNLPSVTPEGAAFHPLLSDHERAALRTLLRKAIARAEHTLS